MGEKRLIHAVAGSGKTKMLIDDLDISKAVKNKHMTFREAANLARLGNVKTLLLTHFSPSLEDPNLYIKNATDVFENTIVGKDRYDINLNFEN